MEELVSRGFVSLVRTKFVAWGWGKRDAFPLFWNAFGKGRALREGSHSFQDWERWHSFSSQCFLADMTGILHLAFLCYILFQFVYRSFIPAEQYSSAFLCKSDHLRIMDLDLSYKTSLSCCIVILGSHILKFVLVILQGKIGSCESAALIFLAMLLQLIGWSIALAMVFNFRKRKTLRLPWILRLWWMCSFTLSAIYIAFEARSILLDDRFPKLEDYADLLTLFALMLLCGISVQGRTGIRLSSGSETDPLLQISPSNNAECQKESPYGNATLLQLITFSWLNSLFVIGIRKPLDQEEVPDLYHGDSAAYNSEVFGNILNSVKEEHGMNNLTTYRTVFLFTRKKVAINALFAVITAAISYVGPSLINDLVKFLSGDRKQGLKSGYLLALAFLSAKIVETVTQRQWIFGARQLGMRLRASLISHIYRKGVHLSSQSRQNHTSGEIVNYMSVDIQRITDFMWYLNVICMLPIQISLAIWVLHSNLGIGCLAAFGATFTVMVFNVPLTRSQKYFQSRIMEAKDERMKTTTEVLRNIKTLKLQAWDSHYLGRLKDLRKIEYIWIWKSLRLNALAAFIFWGSPTFISAITFGSCLLMGIPLTAGRVLSALATFAMLQDPIFNLPDVLNVLAQAKVSMDRVASYLQEDEIQLGAVELIPRNETEFDIEIDYGTFSWNPESESESPTLQEIKLSIRRGMKVAICGTVGGGKSSLLACILGEMPKLAGTVKVSGTKAYIPQSPWILTGNVRENILFGQPYDSERYAKTIQACALEKDFELFASGDLTEIGERGINMSGGQKQRIQIARAVYQDSDIYLLDDPFSAVDAHTGTHLFKECLIGILRDKTILYVTHQVEFLPVADLILVMKDGRIAQSGKFEELLQQNIGFEVLVGAHSQALESVLSAEHSSRLSQLERSNKKDAPNIDEDDSEEAKSYFQNDDRHDSELNIDVNIEERGRLTQEEEREKGSIGKDVYMSYLQAVKGGALVPLILMAQSLFQILQVASNYWMAWATPPTTGTAPTVEMKILFLVYMLLSVGSALCVLLRAMLVAIAGLLTSQKFFMNMLYHVLHAPMSFFDSTPAGRILNRASTDQSVLDLEIAGKLGWCAFSVIRILGTIAVMSQVAWPVFAVFVPVTAICIWYQQYYVPTARELARLSGIQRTPILHHFAESLAGATTIRAFGHESRFTTLNLELIDNHSRPWFHNISAMEWLSFRLNVLSNFVFAFSLILLVSLPEGFINPSIAGLAVTYGLSLNVQQASIIWNICNAENKMISVERILQYSRIKSEAPFLIEDCRPVNNWPQIGTICFNNLQVRYADHLPSVLKNITCTFPGKKKIGVVGRTGSGKSTLIQAIFRTVEPREGSIVIDGIDIQRIGLHDLRSRLSVIPQEPAMFEGTVRGNLDPLEQYSDFQIWEALDNCQLGDIICAQRGKLYSKVVENGENWSVGQRQLFCLGRTLLKRSNILVLDEATASIDSATDNILQQIIRQEFKDRTVITVAHRIHTVIDSDLVLVLSEGRIQEFDTPLQLLKGEDSSFSKLIREYSMRSKSFNGLTNTCDQ